MLPLCPVLFLSNYTRYLIHFSQQSYEIGSPIVPILQMRRIASKGLNDLFTKPQTYKVIYQSTLPYGPHCVSVVGEITPALPLVARQGPSSRSERTQTLTGDCDLWVLCWDRDVCARSGPTRQGKSTQRARPCSPEWSSQELVAADPGA